jgi:hypothetical protein
MLEFEYKQTSLLDLKEKVDLCLKHSKKKPAFRKKLAESIDELQDHLNQLRAEEGNLG